MTIYSKSDLKSDERWEKIDDIYNNLVKFWDTKELAEYLGIKHSDATIPLSKEQKTYVFTDWRIIIKRYSVNSIKISSTWPRFYVYMVCVCVKTFLKPKIIIPRMKITTAVKCETNWTPSFTKCADSFHRGIITLRPCLSLSCTLLSLNATEGCLNCYWRATKTKVRCMYWFWLKRYCKII